MVFCSHPFWICQLFWIKLPVVHTAVIILCKSCPHSESLHEEPLLGLFHHWIATTWSQSAVHRWTAAFSTNTLLDSPFMSLCDNSLNYKWLFTLWKLSSYLFHCRLLIQCCTSNYTSTACNGRLVTDIKWISDSVFL